MMTRGTVKHWNTERGFGFVAVPGISKDVFAHYTALEDLDLLEVGQVVDIEYGREDDGVRLRATRVALTRVPA